MSDPVGSKAAEGGSTTFWKTLPGILTGAAALLTAVGGLIVVLLQVFGSAEPGPPGDPGARSSSETSISETTASASAGAGVLHSDRVEMKDADYVDLETGKVGGPGNDDFYLHQVEQTVAHYGMTAVSGPMTKQNCVAALTDRNDRGVYLSKVTDDQWLCVQTDQGNLSGMRILERPSPGRQVVVFEYVVWK